jgi:hypothetical protein
MKTMSKQSLEHCDGRPQLDEVPLERSPTKTLIIFDGGKGGVGKSFGAGFLASDLLAMGLEVTLIEADQANPDTARRFQHHAPVLLADLGDRDGWISLLGALEAVTTPYIVMSLPAGLNGIESIRDLLQQTLASLGIKVYLMFCLSRQFDSVALIARSLESGIGSFADHAIALTNGFFGRPETYDRWIDSETRRNWLSKGFDESHVSEMNHRLVDLWESKPAPLHHLLATGHMPIVLRLELQNWIGTARNGMIGMVKGG